MIIYKIVQIEYTEVNTYGSTVVQSESIGKKLCWNCRQGFFYERGFDL